MKRSSDSLQPSYGTAVLYLAIMLVAPTDGAGQCAPEARAARLGRTSASSAPVASATFTLSGAGYDETVTYTGVENLVFCVRTSETMLWIRLAESATGNGEDGPHIDIDLCNMTGSATFTPMNPRGQPCPGGLTWGIWWHDGPTVAYANRSGSSPCELALTVDDGVLAGTFECGGLVNQDGTGSLDILDGSFQCVMDERRASSHGLGAFAPILKLYRGLPTASL